MRKLDPISTTEEEGSPEPVSLTADKFSNNHSLNVLKKRILKDQGLLIFELCFNIVLHKHGRFEMGPQGRIDKILDWLYDFFHCRFIHFSWMPHVLSAGNFKLIDCLLLRAYLFKLSKAKFIDSRLVYCLRQSQNFKNLIGQLRRDPILPKISVLVLITEPLYPDMPGSIKSHKTTEPAPVYTYMVTGLKRTISEKEAEKLKFKKHEPNPTSFLGKLELTYYRYCLISGLDMLDPWERFVFSTITQSHGQFIDYKFLDLLTLAFFALVSYNIWTYMLPIA